MTTLSEAIPGYAHLSKDELDRIKVVKEIVKIEEETAKITEERRTVERNNRNFNSNHDNVGVYNFYDDVNHKSVATAIKEIGNLARRQDGQGVKLVLNSPGGSVLDGLALFDFLMTLRASGTHVEVVALGMAASMGGIILQAADTRTMGANSWLLIHEVSAGALGNLSEIEERFEFLKRLQKNSCRILAERSTMSVEAIEEKWKKKDWWLSADEAFELGFIDNII